MKTRWLLWIGMVLILVTRCGGIVDGWGPPAGFGMVRGVVTTAGGAPAPNVEVGVTCASDPIGGLAGRGYTIEDGTYAVEATLPPVGMLPHLDADTLVISCDVIPDRNSDCAVTVNLPFAARRADVQAVTVDLTIP